MKQYFAYIRVSTTRQGEFGVSLPQQKDAIERYAQRNQLEISRWFEEQETAAKQGRPVFGTMVKLLRKQAACGVIIHKIDRSARNLRDWADLGELIDRGVEVHFANESLDLTSRGGRLSADIQAVVASDYIRNLREESKKGIYGRLKQGYYPMPAPLGYRNHGAAQPKTPDPKTAPLVRQAFELYASARYNLRGLSKELYRLGLRRADGDGYHRNRLSKMLNNPFYYGLIRIKKTGQFFTGLHEPLISKATFARVQTVLQGKLNTRVNRHDFVYRRRLKCKNCEYSLIGETAKGHVYYRCHTSTCSTRSLREEVVENAVVAELSRLSLSDEERRYLHRELEMMRGDAAGQRQETIGLLRNPCRSGDPPLATFSGPLSRESREPICRTSGRGHSHGILEGETGSNGMIAINAHYDGRVIVPDEPVDLLPNQALIVRIEAKNVDEPPTRESALAWLVANASDSTDVPSDLSHQHDHYLYGTPKRDV